MENQKCCNCGTDYISTEFIEAEQEVEINGEWVVKKVWICAKCYFGD